MNNSFDDFLLEQLAFLYEAYEETQNTVNAIEEEVDSILQILKGRGFTIKSISEKVVEKIYEE